MKNYVAKPQDDSQESGLWSANAPAMYFAFPGQLGTVLENHFNHDAQMAQLSAKFKLYYRLRPYIPIAVRQMLQKGRNQRFNVAHRYLPYFLSEGLINALEQDGDRWAIHPWPDSFEFASVLTHDVETKDGLALVSKLADLEEKYGLRSAWNLVPYKYPIDAGLVNELKSRGHEIGVHGYNHDGRLFESRKTFVRRVGPINQAIERFGSVGFRAPMVHRNLSWLQELNIEYDASCFDYDPFQAMPGGVGGVWPFIAGKFVELPYTLPQDHTLLVTLGETTARIWFEKLNYVRRLAGMALLITHPDYLDTPRRFDIYRAFLEYVAEQERCWHALPKEIVSWWRERENLQVVDGGSAPQILGPSAERARIFSLAELCDADFLAGKPNEN